MKKPAKKKDDGAEKEEDLKYIRYFYRPTLVEQLWKLELAEGETEAEFRKPVSQVCASGQYTYAVVEKTGEVYSWGMGDNYVLGNRDEENQFEPYKLHPKMFEENKVVMMGLGFQHTVALTLDGPESKLPEVDLSKFVAGPK